VAHSRGRFLARSGPKRSMLWSEGPRITQKQTATALGKVVWNLGQTSGGGVTIVRIRGGFDIWLEAAVSVGDGYNPVAVGIGIVSSDAFAIGATAMPGPLSDPEWDWMWVGYIGGLVGESTTEVFQGMGFHRFDIDTKAMRKIHPNEVVFGMLELGTEQGAATVTFAAMTRLLSKLG